MDKEVKITYCPKAYADGYRNLDSLPYTNICAYQNYRFFEYGDTKVTLIKDKAKDNNKND